MVLALQLADALLFRRQRLALPRLPSLLGIVLGHPATHDAMVAANLAHAQALISNHLRHVQLEGCIEGSMAAVFGHVFLVLSGGIIPYKGVLENQTTTLLAANQPLATVYLLKDALKEDWYVPNVWEG